MSNGELADLDTSRTQPLPMTAPKTDRKSVSQAPQLAQAGTDGGATVSTQANILATLMQPSDTQKIGDPSEDLTLRAAMYGVLFLSFIDKVSCENTACYEKNSSLCKKSKEQWLLK